MLVILLSYSTTTIYSFTSSLISDHLDSWQPSTQFTREIGKKQNISISECAGDNGPRDKHIQDSGLPQTHPNW